MFQDHRGHGPQRSLGERVARLTEDLQRLAVVLKTEVARVVGEAVASAVRDALRRLLGAPTEEARQRPHAGEITPDAWHDDPWAEVAEIEPEPIAPPSPKPSPGRYGHVWKSAIQAGLSWLGRPGDRRPLVSTALVAVAAGGVAFALGPAAGTATTAACAIAGALLTAGSAAAVGERLADLLA